VRIFPVKVKIMQYDELLCPYAIEAWSITVFNPGANSKMWNNV
jgi:hypothetical protein